MSGNDAHRQDEWPDLGKAGEGHEEPGTAGGRKADITRELQELGQQLVATARAAWQSEQRQELQREISDGLRLLRDQLGDAAESVRANPRAQNLAGSVKEQVNKASDSSRINEVFDDVRSGLSTGLRELNEQLRRFTERLERQEDATESTRAAATAAGAAEAAQQTDELLALDAPAPAAETTDRPGLPGKPEGPEGENSSR